MWELVISSGEIEECEQLNIPQQLKTHQKKQNKTKKKRDLDVLSGASIQFVHAGLQ